ncbi:MutS-related protein [Plebeiibacterium marinum]|uniref:DNA mismatch repair proteins mutS family domain-containing protein n=1 Tax=Plebeiibacterium marinum TaxID=2992111 RepID=A0AAE3MCA9_9BACT|nr:hypothetical protein [Plebeiobacterium marinum]MCW3805136.1 hypothetical protein [Plebeiobacterium marinum]
MESTGGIQQRYDELITEYDKLQNKYGAEAKLYSQKIIKTGWARVLLFVLTIGVPVYFLNISIFVSVIAFFTAVGGFVFIIKKFNRYKRFKEQNLHLQELNKNESSALNGNWSCFASGEKFIDPFHNFSHDLDLFGQGSFFQYINRCVTIAGEINLKNKLTLGELEEGISGIKTQQEVLNELSKMLSFRQLFYAKGKFLDESQEDLNRISSFKEYVPWLKNKNIVFQYLIKGMWLLFVLSVVLASFGYLAWLPIFIFLVNLNVVGVNFKSINKLNSRYSVLSNILQKYSELTDLIAKQQFSSDKLNVLKDLLVAKEHNASGAIKKLSTYMNHFDQRNGMLAGVLLNGFFLWDYIYILKIENWFEKHLHHLFAWMDVVHEMDALNSLAGYVYNHPDFVFPELQDSAVYEARKLGHPLLDRKVRVCNDFDFDQSVFALITGANMSGKSTFLRSVGLNLVLANCGAVVCAEKMLYSPIKLVTNMRTTDSLMKNESYFFAELKRLKFIIDKLYAGEKLFIILDEILKGTNSKDKTFGSMALLRKLLNYNVFGMIATHDLELEILEEETGGRISNLCFEVTNDNDVLHFDYKLYKGVTQNHNASFLMKKMGIIDG